MREPKFRVWDKKRKRMFVATTINASGSVSVFIDDGLYLLPAEQVELMQYTGLKDNNGKEIYDGDIVEFGLSGRGERGYVAYADEYASYEVYSKRDFIFGGLFGHAGRVIGNVHENPELLEDEE